MNTIWTVSVQEQRKNEKEVAAAELKVQELDFNIFRKSLSEKKRTLDDAQIRSPRKAILTYINNQIGAQISEGGQVAIISDLSHFKVEGEIADTYRTKDRCLCDECCERRCNARSQWLFLCGTR